MYIYICIYINIFIAANTLLDIVDRSTIVTHSSASFQL